MSTRLNERGFTLVELLIVVVILGILAATVVFAIGNLTGKAEANSCAAEGNMFADAVVGYRAENDDRLPGTDLALAAAELETANLISDADTKYGGALAGWSYDALTGDVNTVSCPTP